MLRFSEIDPLISQYDTFLIDQFGTLHNGITCYTGVVAALLRIRAAGKKVILLSNSGRPVSANAIRLADLGIGPECYDLLLTSGELAARMIAENLIPIARGVSRCLLLERPGEGSILDVVGFQSVAPDAAQLVLIAGSSGTRVRTH